MDSLELAGEEFDISLVAHSLGFLTRVVQIQIREFIRSGGPLEVSPTSFSILSVIRRNPGIRQARIAVLLSLKESNLALLVQQLKKDGLIESRQLEPARKGGLGLTPNGEALVEAVQDKFRAIDRTYAACLTDDEYACLVGLLARVYAAGLDGARAADNQG